MRGKSQQTSSTQSLVSLGQSNLHEFYIGICILMWLLATALIVRIGDFLIMEFAEEFNDSNFWLAVLVGRDCWLIRWCWMWRFVVAAAVWFKAMEEIDDTKNEMWIEIECGFWLLVYSMETILRYRHWQVDHSNSTGRILVYLLFEIRICQIGYYKKKSRSWKQ